MGTGLLDFSACSQTCENAACNIKTANILTCLF